MPINPLKDWKAKLERAHSSVVQSGKLTVWVVIRLFTGVLILESDKMKC